MILTRKSLLLYLSGLIAQRIYLNFTKFKKKINWSTTPLPRSGVIFSLLLLPIHGWGAGFKCNAPLHKWLSWISIFMFMNLVLVDHPLARKMNDSRSNWEGAIISTTLVWRLSDLLPPLTRSTPHLSLVRFNTNDNRMILCDYTGIW